jgi:hypothetical protein
MTSSGHFVLYLCAICTQSPLPFNTWNFRSGISFAAQVAWHMRMQITSKQSNRTAVIMAAPFLLPSRCNVQQAKSNLMYLPWRSCSLQRKSCIVHALLIVHYALGRDGTKNVTGTLIPTTTHPSSRSQWSRRLKRRSATARLLRLWVRIPPGTWMSVVSVVCIVR